jgi:predicted acyltransferase
MSTPEPIETPAPPSTRLVSLDAFRGLTIAGMILVNNPGDWSHVYPPLRHAAWHGWTPTDLVFPSFLFIVGVAIPLALGKRLARGDGDAAVVRKILWRSAVIFAIGLFLNAFPFDRPLATLRIPGVLQRIALCYLVAALIDLKASVRTVILAVVGLLLGYWALLTLVPVPGVGAGDLTRPNNLAAWIDRGVMPGHIYKSDYDPEGLLSTLPAVATTLIGVLAGHWLRGPRPIGERVAGLFAAGAVWMFVGSAWDHVFPINKALWTSSFVLWSAGLSLQILGLCAWLIDVLGVRRWALPFLVLGSNAIAAYVLSGIGARALTIVKVAGPDGSPIALKSLLYERGFLSWADPTLASCLWGLSYAAVWVALMAILYRLKWFIRV